MGARKRKPRNMMIVAVVYGALADRTGPPGAEGPIMNATVHAWYEGHIAAEDARREPPLAASQAMADAPEDAFPMPPWPTKEAAREIIDATLAKFDEDDLLPAAVAYAAARAWKGGAAEGRTCRGCSFRGTHPEIARTMRTGADVELLFDGLKYVRGDPRRVGRSR